MLTHIDIRNVVLIDHLTLDVGAGLTALTGETGAGKSILLDALGLIRGDRSDAGLVRKGSNAATVTALFDIPTGHAVQAMLHDQGIECDDVLSIRRIVGVDGKSKAFVNDTPVTIAFLKTIGQMVIDLHGQFETGNLFDPSYHRDLVDAYGNLLPLRANVAVAWRNLVTARETLDQAQQDATRAEKERDYIAASLDDLNKLAAEVGEEDSLLDRKNLIQSRATIVEHLTSAFDTIAGEDGADMKLGLAARSIERLRSKMPERVDAWQVQIDEALSSVRDLTSDMERILFDHGAGEESIDQIEDRLHDLRAAARRFSCRPDDLSAKRDEFERAAQMIVQGADHIVACQRHVKQAYDAYIKQAYDLSVKRVQAALKLDAGVMAELPPLKLDRARFETIVDRLPDDRHGPDGFDSVRFVVATNPGSNPGALDKIASGGELSRLMLALKVVMRTAAHPHLCMIFDEVDSGLGGAVADAMAQRLARLSERSQVLVVTHAPQVAARATHHWVIAKETEKNSTTTSVTILDTQVRRREEIARMLSGEQISNEARAAAQKLLDQKAA